MMNKENIRAIFEIKYDSKKWQALLTSLFPQLEFYETPENVKQDDLQQHQIAKSIKRFGRCKLTDEAVVAFYEVELIAGRNVTRNRVSLRNLIHTNIIPGDVDAVLAVYFNPAARDWRVSLISRSLSWDEEMKEVRTETQPKRYTFVLGETETVRTATERFEALFKQSTVKDKIVLADLLKAFSVEKISNEFFKEYHQHFERFEEYIVDSKYYNHFLEYARGESRKEQKEETERLARNFTKKLLGRIVFLYFLQKKGWLGVPKDKDWGDGEKDFVSQLFKNFKDKHNFYTRCLVPLFFETLNYRRSNDIFEITDTRIPYLNGGLFDRDPIEPVEIQFKESLFADLFDFFDRYNFTIDENSPDDQDIGIDPEMLGLIFENLLEDNRRKGTYYTPKEVVHFMCKESLRLYIRNGLKKQTTEKELRDIDAFVMQVDKVDLKTITKFARDIDSALSNVKICDPAIGSGAFPMGMVFEILQLKKELFGFIRRKIRFDYSKEKLAIIRNSIYGVDIDQGAVDIARLRFWLALIVDEDKPKSLPNLDYKIMQGDSLQEAFEGIPLDRLTQPDVQIFEPATQLHLSEEFEPLQKTLAFSTDEKAKLGSWVKDYFNEDDYRKKEELRDRIDTFIHNELAAIVDREKAQKERLIGEAKKTFENKLTFLTDKKKVKYQQTGKELKIIARLEHELQKITEKENKLHETQCSQEKPYFLWHLFFSDVLVDGNGFDIVIANPPYGVKVDDDTKRAYNLGSKDSYGVFMSMSLDKLVKSKGIICFIVSDTWLTIKSHFKLREQILNYQLHKVIRLHQDCFKATVNSCIFTSIKAAHEESQPHVIAADLTNISTRKNVSNFRDKLFRLGSLVGQATPEFAVYAYEQNLLNTNSTKPIIVGSPKLFQLMNDTICHKETTTTIRAEGEKEFEVRKIQLNGKAIELLRFGDVAEVKQGLATGDNQYYLYQNPKARGSYKNINLYRQYLLIDADLAKIHADNELRMKIIKNGFHKSKNEKPFEPDRWFEGRYIVPYDKGGESDTEDGWLPNYYVPTDYFIDWSTEAVERLKTLTTKGRNRINGKLGGNNKLCSRFQNIEFYFQNGLTYSRSGVYAPTFRLNNFGPFDTKGNFIPILDDQEFCLGALNSKLARFFFKAFICHTVEAEGEDVKEIPIIHLSMQNVRIINLVQSIINNQKQTLQYNFLINEQKQIDRIVYDLYGLNDEDINEVETWFARRYPKLAKYADIKSPEELRKHALSKDEYIEKLKAFIVGGENKQVEFKSTLRYCLRQKSVQKYIEHEVMKNIAAFLNSEGGTIFIGVDDYGRLLGLDHDFSTFRDRNKTDVFLKHLDNLVSNYLGDTYSRYLAIDFPEIDEKQVCVVEIKQKAAEPVFLINKQKNNQQEFYIRRFASTVTLTPREAWQYQKEHWGN